MLDVILQEMKLPLNLVVNLDVPFDVILQRIQDRWIHAESGRVYNLRYSPPEKPGLDDITGEPLSKRPDDNVDIVKRRLVKYKEVTLPLMHHYKDTGILVNFKGESSDEIYPKLKQVLERVIQ